MKLVYFPLYFVLLQFKCMAYIQSENKIQLHLTLGVNFGSCYFLGRGGTLGTKNPYPEDTERC